MTRILAKSEPKCLISRLSVPFLKTLLATNFGTNLWPSTHTLMPLVSDSHQRKEFSPTDRGKVRVAGALHTCITQVRTPSLSTKF